MCVPEQRIVDIVTTSGTTGEPLFWKLTEKDLERLATNEYLSFRCAGFDANEKVLLAVAMDRCFIAGMAYFLGLRKLGCAVARVGPATPLMHLDLLQRLAATSIVGVPSFLALLADKAAEQGLEFRELLAIAGVGEAQEERVLVLEVVVDGALGHAGRGGDILEACGVVAALGEDTERGREDLTRAIIGAARPLRVRRAPRRDAFLNHKVKWPLHRAAPGLWA